MEVFLKLPNEVEIIQPAVDFVYRWAVENGLGEKEAEEFATAFDELITDVVLFAFEEKGEFSVFLKSSLSQLEVTVQELGEPFDPERHRYSVERFVREGNFDGAGFEIIRNLADDFIYIYKGRAGKEFRIIKYIKHRHITQMLPEEKLKAEPEKAVGYQISPVSEEDAEDIARLIYRSYGYTYPKEDMYYPDRIVKAVKEGRKFGVIVRTDRGEAVGYFAVIKMPDSNIGEVGEVVVSPKHRGKGIMKMMMKALIDMARSKGLYGLFGEAVTVHTISQKVNAKYGFKSTALVLGFFPYAKYKGFEHKQQRISVVIDFLPLVERKEVKVFLPDPYKNILKKIYRNLGIQAVNIPVRKQPALKERSKIDLQINYRFSVAVVVVGRYGKDFFSRLDKKIDSLKKKGIKGIYIDLPLDDPYTKEAAEQLIERGFIFSGLMPLFHKNKDHLRMQMLTESIDLRWVNIFSDMAEKIKRFINRQIKKRS